VRQICETLVDSANFSRLKITQGNRRTSMVASLPSRLVPFHALSVMYNFEMFADKALVVMKITSFGLSEFSKNV
jgi:hypothetical protein